MELFLIFFDYIENDAEFKKVQKYYRNYCCKKKTTKSEHVCVQAKI